MSLSQSLPPQERPADRGQPTTASPTTAPKAIETYEKLVAVSPNNARIQFELARLYEQTGDLAKAQGHFAKAVALDPKYVEGLTAVGRVAIKRGDPQGVAAAAEQRAQPGDSAQERRGAGERAAGDRHCLQADGPAGGSAEAVSGVAGDQAPDRAEAWDGRQSERNRADPGGDRQPAGGREELQRGARAPAGARRQGRTPA